MDALLRVKGELVPLDRPVRILNINRTGFAVLSEAAVFHYKCTHPYSPGNECTVRWDDPDLGIPWPVTDPVLSTKDREGLRLRDVAPERLFP